MDKRKIFKICMFVLLFFVIMAVVEIGLRGISKGISNISNNIKEAKKEQEIYNSEYETSKRDVKEFVNNVLNALKDEDYDYVTHYLDRRYFKYFFDNDKEKVKTALSSFLDKNTTYQITNVSDAEQRYYVNIGFTSGDNFYTKYVTVFGTNVENYRIMFEYCDYIATSDYYAKMDGLSFENIFNYSLGGEIIYPIDISNNSGESVEIEFTNAYLFGSAGTQIESDIPDKITIGPNEMQRIKLISKNITEDVQYLHIDIKVNNVEEKIKMYSSKEFDM